MAPPSFHGLLPAFRSQSFERFWGLLAHGGVRPPAWWCALGCYNAGWYNAPLV